MDRQLKATEDGSYTLYVPQLDEHYHSIHGAIQESNHIFIQTGLMHCSKQEVNVLEIGFGTGLNAYLTLKASQELQKKIEYTSLEAYPLSVDLVVKLNYTEKDTPDLQASFRKMHEVKWGESSPITDSFSLLKIETDFTHCDFSNISGIDLLYFDAFAPEKQPEMWSEVLFARLYACMNDTGILVTYCAKGVVRRSLQAVGFTVERLPGPPGKREMLRATK